MVNMKYQARGLVYFTLISTINTQGLLLGEAWCLKAEHCMAKACTAFTVLQNCVKWERKKSSTAQNESKGSS